MYAKAAVSVMMGQDNGNDIDEDVGRWNCCGARYL